PRSARHAGTSAASAASRVSAAPLRSSAAASRCRGLTRPLADVELDAPVLLPPVGGVVVGDGPLRAEALRREPARVDATPIDQVLHDRVGAVVGQLLVELIGAAVVGVPLDGQ